MSPSILNNLMLVVLLSGWGVHSSRVSIMGTTMQADVVEGKHQPEPVADWASFVKGKACRIGSTIALMNAINTFKYGLQFGDFSAELAEASCPNSDGIKGYKLLGYGPWSIQGASPFGETASNQDCADKCSGYSWCDGFSRAATNNVCMLYKTLSQEGTASRVNAYTKCQAGSVTKGSLNVQLFKGTSERTEGFISLACMPCDHADGKVGEQDSVCHSGDEFQPKFMCRNDQFTYISHGWRPGWLGGGIAKEFGWKLQLEFGEVIKAWIVSNKGHEVKSGGTLEAPCLPDASFDAFQRSPAQSV